MNEFKKIQYNCKKATLLIEKKAFTKITFREEIELCIHLMGCSVCVLYKKQSTTINNMMLQLFKSGNDTTDVHQLDELYKKQLQDKIEQQLSK